jgi:hypothetical protein
VEQAIRIKQQSAVRGRGIISAISIALCSSLAVLFLAPAACGQQYRPSEYQVKATYLYDFSRFVEWPEQSADSRSGPFLICVLGQNPFGRTLNDLVANENIGGKSVVAKQVNTADDAAGCRVVFISFSEEAHLKQILASLNSSSALTVSDLPRFTERGGMIQFVLENNHVRFQVNIETAKHAGIAMSSELLKLAVGIRKNSTFGN